MKSGSGMVEFVIGAWIISVLLVGFVVLSRIGFQRQRALSLANFGTRLQATGLLSEAVVNEEMQRYLEQLKSPEDHSWTWSIGAYVGSPAARFYHLVETHVRCEITGLGRWILEGTTEIHETVVMQQSP